MNIKTIFPNLPYDGEVLPGYRDALCDWDESSIAEIYNAFIESDNFEEPTLTPDCVGEVLMLLMQRFNFVNHCTNEDLINAESGANGNEIITLWERGVFSQEIVRKIIALVEKDVIVKQDLSSKYDIQESELEDFLCFLKEQFTINSHNTNKTECDSNNNCEELKDLNQRALLLFKDIIERGSSLYIEEFNNDTDVCSESSILYGNRHIHYHVIPRFQDKYDEWKSLTEGSEFEQYRLAAESELLAYDEKKATIVCNFCAHRMMYEEPDIFFRDHLPQYLQNIQSKKLFGKILKEFEWRDNFYFEYCKYCEKNDIETDPYIISICSKIIQPTIDKEHIDWYSKIPESRYVGKTKGDVRRQYEMASRLYDELSKKGWFRDGSSRELFIYRLTGLNGAFNPQCFITLSGKKGLMSEWAHLMALLYRESGKKIQYSKYAKFYQTEGGNQWANNWAAFVKEEDDLSKQFATLLCDIGYCI